MALVTLDKYLVINVYKGITLIYGGSLLLDKYKNCFALIAYNISQFGCL